ncbi:MAG: sugar ABC transporter substrate-binding protein [Ketobacter sp.]|nr:sugar ABC transporter substrate-binding protein [Ketobacter sp.]
MMSNSVIIAILILVLLLSIVFLLVAQVTRGGVRISARITGYVLLFPTCTALSILFFSSGQNVSVAVSVAGIVISFIFGFAGHRLSVTGSTRPCIGIVIASKVPFHQEIRKALYSELDSHAGRIIDFGGAFDAPLEDLTAFSKLLTNTMTKKVDYLIVWPPGLDAANGSDLLNAATYLRKRGGLCLFLENGPNRSNDDELNYVRIRHNALIGASLLSDGIRQLFHAESPRILILLGPSYSPPALERNSIIASEFPEAERVRHIQLGSWSSSDAVESLCRLDEDDLKYDIIVCPNDRIALAIVDALLVRRELKKIRKVRVVGFDGLPRAIACIAEQFTPFELTVAIPPSEYGMIAGKIIKELGSPRLRPVYRLRKACQEVEITMDNRNLINPARARSRLYGH